MNRDDEKGLLLRAQAGDGMAFGMLVRQHQTAVFNVAYRLLGRRGDAEDAAQEAFLKAFRALERFDVERPFAPWIKRIVTNHCYNLLESARVKPTLLATEMGEAGADLDEWAQHAPSPEQRLVSDERETAVRQAILQLPPRYRTVLELRHFQGLSYAEIEETQQRSLSDIKSDLFRARKKLAQLLRGRL